MSKDYIKCVLRPMTFAEKTGLPNERFTWCGLSEWEDWSFTSLDHAAQNGLNKGRLLTCLQCVRQATNAMLQDEKVEP